MAPVRCDGINDHPPPPDENALVIPKTWSHRIHPRRGGAPSPKIVLDASVEKTVAGLVDAAGEDIGRVLGYPSTDPDLAAAARAHLGGDPDPRGAAVVALIANGPHRFSDDFVDAWTFTHGVVFAACAEEYAEAVERLAA